MAGSWHLNVRHLWKVPLFSLLRKMKDPFIACVHSLDEFVSGDAGPVCTIGELG